MQKKNSNAFSKNGITGSLFYIFETSILGMTDVSVFSPVSSALGFAAIAVATPIIGEKIDKYTVISTVIAILSIVVPTLLV